jgi:hypothetical protein
MAFRSFAAGALASLLLPVAAWSLDLPAQAPAAVPNESIQLTFEGRPGPLVPERVGQRVKVEAWFLGRPLPLDRCAVTFPGDWARLEIHDSGKFGWITVTKMDKGTHELTDEEFRYEIKIEFKAAIVGTARIPAKLALNVPCRLHRLQSTITLPSGVTKPFDLLTHPDIVPVTEKDVFVWPPAPATEVVIWRKALWVGFSTEEVDLDEATFRGMKPCKVILVALRLKLKTGGTRWLYTNVVPTTLRHPGWDDQASRLRLPVFPDSLAVYREAAAWFKGRSIPFEGLVDTSHVEGDLTGR